MKRTFNPDILNSNQDLSRPWPNIVEWDIIGYKKGKKVEPLQSWNDLSSLAKADTIMKQLYEKVLINDPLWHFIVEGSYNVLRVSVSSKSQVEKFFKAQKLVVRYKGAYERDGQPGTELFQKVFTYLFHGFSVLAMEMTPQQLTLVSDRVYHIFNMSNMYNALNFVEPYGVNWEAHLLTYNALHRSFYVGKYSSEFLKVPDNLQVSKK